MQPELSASTSFHFQLTLKIVQSQGRGTFSRLQRMWTLRRCIPIYDVTIVKYDKKVAANQDLKLLLAHSNRPVTNCKGLAQLEQLKNPEKEGEKNTINPQTVCHLPTTISVNTVLAPDPSTAHHWASMGERGFLTTLQSKRNY